MTVTSFKSSLFDYLYGAFTGLMVSLVCLPPTFVVITLLPRGAEAIKVLFPAVYAAVLLFAAAIATYVATSHGYRKIVMGLWVGFAIALLVDLVAALSGLAWYHPYSY